MQAGRELDAKVAEALGMQLSSYESEGGQMPIIVVEGIIQELPKFSTTWEGMGVLLEEARAKGYRVTINHICPNSLDFKDGNAELGDYHCCWAVSGNDDRISFHHSHSKSAPLAVCVAFLKVKGIEVP